MKSALPHNKKSWHQILRRCVCACYISRKPKIIHISQVKRNLRYINETCDYGILYSHDTNPVQVGYCDVDWDGSVDDGKRTYDVCFFLGNILISWFKKKQNCASLSI